MKFLLFALVLVVAGAYAMPSASDVVVVDSSNQPAPTIIIDDIIRRIIQLISTGMKKIGLDPFVIKKIDINWPRIPKILTVKSYIHDLKFDGASNIQINSLDYNVFHSKFSFDISHPQLSLVVGDSGTQVAVFDKEFDERFNGSLIIESIRLTGEISVKVGIFNHISLRNVTLNFTVGDIKSDLNFSALGNDYSDVLNNIFNEFIPFALNNYADVINKFLEDIVKAIFKDNMCLNKNTLSQLVYPQQSVAPKELYNHSFKGDSDFKQKN